MLSYMTRDGVDVDLIKLGKTFNARFDIFGGLFGGKRWVYLFYSKPLTFFMVIRIDHKL